MKRFLKTVAKICLTTLNVTTAILGFGFMVTMHTCKGITNLIKDMLDEDDNPEEDEEPVSY